MWICTVSCVSSLKIIPLQTIPVVVWGALLQGCPGSPVSSWPSSSSEQQFYTLAGRLSPPWCTMRNRGSRALRCESKRRKCFNHSLWFKAHYMVLHTHTHTFQGIGKTKLDSPLMTCSGEMVFFSDLLHISLASEDMRWMNSVQQLTTSSLASLATRTLGRVSLIILLIAALGMVRSSSFPEEEAIVAVDGTETREKRKRNSDTRRKETVTRPSRVGRIKI